MSLPPPGSSATASVFRQCIKMGRALPVRLTCHVSANHSRTRKECGTWYEVDGEHKIMLVCEMHSSRVPWPIAYRISFDLQNSQRRKCTRQSWFAPIVPQYKDRTQQGNRRIRCVLLVHFHSLLPGGLIRYSIAPLSHAETYHEARRVVFDYLQQGNGCRRDIVGSGGAVRYRAA